MTGSKVLIVKLPELHADVKMLEAFRAYVCDALGAGALVLPLGTTYAVEEFPALGAVEVVAGNALPVVIGGPRPTPAGGGGGLVVGGRVVCDRNDAARAAALADGSLSHAVLYYDLCEEFARVLCELRRQPIIEGDMTGAVAGMVGSVYG